MGTKTSTETPQLQFTLDNGSQSIAYLHTNDEKAEVLNNYFSLISCLDDSKAKSSTFSSSCNNFIILILLFLNMQDVIDIISILQTNKAVGPDAISHKMLKTIMYTIVKPLCLLFNHSLTDCAFPCSWKISYVLSIFKKGDSSQMSNYRPVSLLSCVSKVMERIIFKHMYIFFNENNLFYKYQAGFLPGHALYSISTFRNIRLYT